MANYFHSVLIFLMALGFLTVTMAQEPIFNPVQLSDHFEVNDIIQDDNEFLWLSTNQGLVYYNGFESKKIESRKGNIYDIEDIGDSLFVTRDNGKIDIYSISKQALIDSIDLNITSRVSDIIILNGHYFATSYGDGLFEIRGDDSGWQVKHVADVPSKFIYQIEALSNGQDLVLATDHGLNLFNISSKSVKTFTDLPDIIVSHLHVSDKDEIWCSTYDSGIYKFDIATEEVDFFPSPRQERIFDILEFANEVYYSSQSGLWKLNEKHELSRLQIGNLLSKVSKLFVDVECNLWLTNGNNQLWKAKIYFQTVTSPIESTIQSVAYFDNTIFAGTHNGLFCFNEAAKDWKLVHRSNVTKLKSRGQYLFAGTYTNGIFVINRDKKIVAEINTKVGLADNAILDFQFDNEEVLYVSTLSGIQCLRFKATDATFDMLDIKFCDDADNYAYNIELYVDQSNQLWAGMDKNGMRKVTDTTYQFKELGHEKLGSVYSIAQSSDGSLFISSENLGLLAFKNDTLQRIEEIRFTDDAYSSIIPLHNNYLLLVRRNSIDLFDATKYHCMYFDNEIQVSNADVFSNNYFSTNDFIYFVHDNRIIRYSTNSILEKIHPSTLIDKVEVNLVKIEDEKKCFDEEENNFKFEFTGSWLTDPTKLSYMYKLEGFDSVWRVTKDRSVSYPHLPHGKYTFRVKSAENNYFSDEPITDYHFVIHQDFFNHAIFRFMSFGIIVAFVFWLYRRHKLQETLTRELEQRRVEALLINLKSQLNPHFLFNSFNTLLGMIEESPKRSVTYVEQLSDFYRAILMIGDKELITLSEELSIVNNYIQLLSARFGNGLIINIELQDQNSYIPPLTLQMIVENAIKHNQVSKKNALVIDLKMDDHYIVVRNNLNPKNWTAKESGHGLNNIFKRYEILCGKLPQVSHDQSYFEIRLPLIYK